MIRSSLRLASLLLLAVFAAPLGFADRAEDLVRIHTEAIGGAERIKALASMRATGRVVAGGKGIRFSMVAARPDRIRVETEKAGRTLVQGFDGAGPAWEFDTGEWPPRYRDIAPGVAKTFVADAEYDDPLVAGPARGFTIEYAGEATNGGTKYLRLLVTRKLTETFALLLDPDTYFIVKRVEQKKNALGRMVQLVTHYRDYRPVEGVLVPHEVALIVDDRVAQETKIDSIEPNPEIAPDTFSRPRAVILPK